MAGEAISANARAITHNFFILKFLLNGLTVKMTHVLKLKQPDKIVTGRLPPAPHHLLSVPESLVPAKLSRQMYYNYV
jgi:hypothetical protein